MIFKACPRARESRGLKSPQGGSRGTMPPIARIIVISWASRIFETIPWDHLQRAPSLSSLLFSVKNFFQLRFSSRIRGFLPSSTSVHSCFLLGREFSSNFSSRNWSQYYWLNNISLSTLPTLHQTSLTPYTPQLTQIDAAQLREKNINHDRRGEGVKLSWETIIKPPPPPMARVSCRTHRGRGARRRCLSKTEGFVLKRLIPKWVITYKTRGP